MEGRYILELRDRDPATVEDLVLDGCESTEIEGLSDKLVKLQSLSMVHVGLQSLKNLPKLPMLGKLDISDNSIAGGLEHVADNCPELLHLNLASNKIAKIEDLEPLKKMKLCELDLFNNPLTAGSDGEYRSKIFEMIPSLQILDGADVNGEDVDDSLDGEVLSHFLYLVYGPLYMLQYRDEDESEEYKPSDERRNEETNGDESATKKKADDE
ncbi:unnamed protein product [Heligmosomoides polygyrus]|uniref:LRRcap domain-containing protein n=1 Tax=Heligmosomoides polygyrus TaxID=6339 RepID=A0A183GK24_HELPZ|nr:unnamed protein product [Heligmosomoides polygyrus]